MPTRPRNSRSRSIASASSPAPSGSTRRAQRQHAQRVALHRRLGAAAASARACADSVVRGSTTSAAPLTYATRSLADEVHGGHALALGAEGDLAAAAARARPPPGVAGRPSRRARPARPRSGRRRPTSRRRPGTSRASLHSSAGAQELRQRRGIDDLAVRAEAPERLVAGALHARSSRCGVQTRCTVISFSVSVPVLSVQMTVVSPSVSTADRRRTSALRLRHPLRTPSRATASRSGSSPFGTSATDHADREHEPVLHGSCRP